MVKHYEQKQSCIKKNVFFWRGSNAQSFKTAVLGGGFHFSNRKHATPKQQKEGDRKDEGEKKGNKKENHICQTVSKNKKANASRTFSLAHLIHLHTFHFTCAPQIHLRISTLTHLRTPFKTNCQYWCMSDRNLTRAPQQNFITCAHHWNRVFF